MGQTISTASTTAETLANQDKLNFFSTIFSRLIEKSDIVDLKALTSGPGACGNYVMLLSKNIQTDFKKIKLQTGISESSLNDFLYSPAQKVMAKSSSKETACTYLAIFYIRTLQLVAALTMSIYSPPDLIARITRKVYETALKVDRRTQPQDLSPAERAARKQKREEWLDRFLSSTEQPGIFLVNEKSQFRYNKVTTTLIYTSPEPLEYRLRLEVKDLDTYSVAADLMKPDTNWIEITNYYMDFKDRTVIYRVLVDGQGKGWVFAPNKDETVIEEEVLLGPYRNWDHDLEQFILDSTVPGEKPALKPNTQFGLMPFSKFQTKKVNSKNRNITVKANNNIRTNGLTPNSLALSEKTQLPLRYQTSYKTMVNWWNSVKQPDWPEASPASFRASLLYNKPALPTSAGSTYICDNIWSGKNLRTIPPFAALEALYFNRDDGSADSTNANLLIELSKAFNIIYENAPKGNVIKAPQTVASFMDVILPTENLLIKKALCSNISAQGESQLDAKVATILAKAQADIIAGYKQQVESAYDILRSLFEMTTVNGETVIKFTDSFVSSPKGVRLALEQDIIPVARSLIANHYIDTEQIYFDALKKVKQYYENPQAFR